MVKEAFVRKLVVSVLVLFLIFVFSSSFYFYLESRTNVSILSANLEFIKDFIRGEIFVSLEQGIVQLNKLILTQIVVFLISTLSLVALIWHMFGLFMIQKKSALIDPLTGLNNRRAILFGLKRELLRANRFKHSISVAMIDIDFFKKYNDLNGHVVGDRALKKVANVLRKHIRGSDLLGRIGGEEFIILFPETTIKNTLAICEGLRMAIEKADFVGEEKQPNGALTISIGITGLEKGKGTRNRWQLIAKADENLYRAKKAGRNNVKA